MLNLEKPDQGAFDRWFEESTQRQAVDRAWVAGGSVAEHRAQLDAMIPQLLPEGMNTPGHTFRTAQTDEGEEIAFVWFGPVPGMSEDMHFLLDIFVSPEHRRKGYARKVLEEMLRKLSTDGIREVTLTVRGDNSKALALYESLGFVRTETSKDGKQVRMNLELRSREF